MQFGSQILMGVSMERIVNFLAEEMKNEQSERERKARIKKLLKNIGNVQSQPVVNFLAEFGD
jgi:hypothetical protein